MYIEQIVNIPTEICEVMFMYSFFLALAIVTAVSLHYQARLHSCSALF